MTRLLPTVHFLIPTPFRSWLSCWTPIQMFVFYVQCLEKVFIPLHPVKCGVNLCSAPLIWLHFVFPTFFLDLLCFSLRCAAHLLLWKKTWSNKINKIHLIHWYLQWESSRQSRQHVYQLDVYLENTNTHTQVMLQLQAEETQTDDVSNL